MNDFLKKLQELGLNIDNASNLNPPARLDSNVDSFIEGEWVESNGQRVFVVKRLHAIGQNHGNIILQSRLVNGGLTEFWQIDGIPTLNLKELVFLDTETSSLSTGAGALIFLFGCCYFTDEGLEVLQVFIEDPSHEILFLNYIDNLLQKFKCLVTYNGKSFDIPVLRSRFILNRIPHNFENFIHLDLLQTSRRIWKYELDSKRLSDIEKKILKFRRSEEEIPGWLVPQIYQDYVQTGNAEAMKGVFYHNEVDVLSLGALLLKIDHMLSLNELSDKESLSMGEIFQKAGKFSKANDHFRQALKNNPEGYYREKILMNLGYSLKKQQNYEEMCHVWEELAQRNNINACVELAKFNEHLKRDYSTALIWTEMATRLVQSSSEYPQNFIGELEHRKERLKNKMANDK